MLRKTGEVVLVTGGSGFLGQHVVRLLQERDDRVKEIRVLDLVPYVNKLGHAENKVFNSYVGNVADVDAVRAVFVGVDCVIHCAALVSYQFPSDVAALERNNVQGTQNVIDLCVECNVPRLVHGSTAEVVLVPYIKGTFTAIIINQTECKATPPLEENTLIFSAYAASKLRAERLVLDADATPLSGGVGTLRTVALRPTLLYGEQDRRLIPSLVRVAEAYDGRTVVRFAGTGGKQQNTYAGNAAWAHLRAKDMLLDKPGNIAGLPVFVTDDTPAQDLIRFADNITSSYDSPSRCRPSCWYIPVLLGYLIAGIIEVVVSTLLHPKVTLPVAPRVAVAYLSSIIYLNRLRAAIHMDYSPIYSAEDSFFLSRRYYAQLKVPRCGDRGSDLDS